MSILRTPGALLRNCSIIAAKVIRIITKYLRGLDAGFRKSNAMKVENVATFSTFQHVAAYNVISADPTKTELDSAGAERLLLLHGMVHSALTRSSDCWKVVQSVAIQGGQVDCD